MRADFSDPIPFMSFFFLIAPDVIELSPQPPVQNGPYLQLAKKKKNEETPLIFIPTMRKASPLQTLSLIDLLSYTPSLLLTLILHNCDSGMNYIFRGLLVIFPCRTHSDLNSSSECAYPVCCEISSTEYSNGSCSLHTCRLNKQMNE